MSNFRVIFYKNKKGIVENAQLANIAPFFAPSRLGVRSFEVFFLKFMML